MALDVRRQRRDYWATASTDDLFPTPAFGVCFGMVRDRFEQILADLSFGPVDEGTPSVTGIRLESGAREETGRFRDVKRCVATGDRTRVSGFSLLRHNR